MPNWAQNILTITGAEDRVKVFLSTNQNEDGDFSFEGALPYPEELKRVDEGGYEWCLGTWGTKWDAEFIEVAGYDNIDGSATIRFCTAWSSPLRWLEFVARRWHELGLNIYTEDLGNGWAIEVGYQGGRRVLDRHRTLAIKNSSDEPYWGPWEELPPIDPIWEGYERPAWTVERAKAVHRARGNTSFPRFLAWEFGLVPGEERRHLEWLAACHPERFPALIERSRRLETPVGCCILCRVGEIPGADGTRDLCDLCLDLVKGSEAASLQDGSSAAGRSKEEINDQSIEDAIRRLEEAIAELDADDHPGQRAEGGGSRAPACHVVTPPSGSSDPDNRGSTTGPPDRPTDIRVRSFKEAIRGSQEIYIDLGEGRDNERADIEHGDFLRGRHTLPNTPRTTRQLQGQGQAIALAADNHNSGVGVINTYGATVHYLPLAGERDRWLVITLDRGRVGVVGLPWTRAEVRRDIETHGGDILYDDEEIFPEGTEYVAEIPRDL